MSQPTLFGSAEKWPRLSETLTGPRDRNHCWRCAVLGSREDRSLVAWREHDDQDLPAGGRYVILCPACSEAIIERHPRLYNRMDRRQPVPGLTVLCDGCPHLEAQTARCRSPLARFNGGPPPGMQIHAEHTTGFICARGKGSKGFGGPFILYTDEHKAYNGLDGYFVHEAVNHTLEYVRGQVHTNGLENFWCLFKRAIEGTYTHCESFHLQRYVDEQLFRFNDRKDDDRVRFINVMRTTVGRRMTWRRLCAVDGCGFMGLQ